MDKEEQQNKKDYFLPISIVVAAVIIGGTLVYTTGLKADPRYSADDMVVQTLKNPVSLEESVLPQGGIRLPIKWGDLGVRMVEAGVIDKDKLESIYTQRGGLNEGEKEFLYGVTDSDVEINAQNAGFLLNLLWAFGLSNRNEILEQGPMADPRYGNAGNFASTGGWTLAMGGAMSHYSRHAFVVLTEKQQGLVERVSKNIYRPCCNNSVYFPDCNHGMAMLGLLELMASQGASEDEMYKIALQVNSYWFPDTYLTIAKYLQEMGIPWNSADTREILSAEYSSVTGYSNILSQIENPESSGGGSCGV